jgi:hypothetical protein
MRSMSIIFVGCIFNSCDGHPDGVVQNSATKKQINTISEFVVLNSVDYWVDATVCENCNDTEMIQCT